MPPVPADVPAYLRPPDPASRWTPTEEAIEAARAAVQALLSGASLQASPSKEGHDAALLSALGSSSKKIVHDMQALLVEAVVQDLLDTSNDSLAARLRRLVPSLRCEDDRLVVHILDYLPVAGHCPARFEPQYLAIRNGMAELGPSHAMYLLRTHLVRRHRFQVPAQVPAWIKAAFKVPIGELNKGIGKRRAEDTRIRKLGLQERHLPPCIRAYVQRLGDGQHITHHMRFNLVAFMHHQRMATEDIVALFSRAPGFDEHKTRYQVEHITGGGDGGYHVMSCAKMRDYGVCMDTACRGITPIREYAWRIRSANKTQAGRAP